MQEMAWKNSFPWQLQFMVKVATGQLHANYRLLKQLGLAFYGKMQQPEYAYNVFMQHFKYAPHMRQDLVVLELGPGDSLSSALIAHTLGVSKSYLVDAGDYAEHDIRCYRQLVQFLKKNKLDVTRLERCRSPDDYMTVCNSTYLTSGLTSLQTIPDSSVDFIWSHAVLEHIKQIDFLETLKELRRIIKTSGVCSHVMDLRDHMNGSLNHLRLSAHWWSSPLIRDCDFPNRIRFSEALNNFRLARFEPKIVRLKRWKHLPLPKTEMAREFQMLDDQNLCVMSFHALLHPF